MSESWFTETVVDRIIGGEDDLGRLAQSMADSQASLPDDPGRRSALIDSVVALGTAGVVPPRTTAYFLDQRDDLSSEQVVAAVLELAESGIGYREVWAALATLGPAGLAVLERAACENRDVPGGVIKALASADRERAVRTVRHRLFVLGRAVEDADVAILKDLPDDAVSLLAEAFRRSPNDAKLAKNLGFTTNSLAKEVLLDPKWRRHPDGQVRQAVVHGLGAFLSDGHDAEVEEALLWWLGHDEDRSVRLVTRARLEIRGIISPQTSSTLDERVSFETSHQDPEITAPEQGGGAGAVVELLRLSGPGRRWALEILLSDDRLRKELARPDAEGPTVEALRDLEQQALRGELGVEIVTALFDLCGDRFARATLDAVAADMSGKVSPTAFALWRHLRGRIDVYTVLCKHAGRHQHPLIVAGLATYDLDVLARAQVLIKLLRGLREPAPGAVRVWCMTLAALLEQQLTSDQSDGLRTVLHEAIQHVIALSAGLSVSQRLQQRQDDAR